MNKNLENISDSSDSSDSDTQFKRKRVKVNDNENISDESSDSSSSTSVSGSDSDSDDDDSSNIDVNDDRFIDEEFVEVKVDILPFSAVNKIITSKFRPDIKLKEEPQLNQSFDNFPLKLNYKTKNEKPEIIMKLEQDNYTNQPKPFSKVENYAPFHSKLHENLIQNSNSLLNHYPAVNSSSYSVRPTISNNISNIISNNMLNNNLHIKQENELPFSQITSNSTVVATSVNQLQTQSQIQLKLKQPKKHIPINRNLVVSSNSDTSTSVSSSSDDEDSLSENELLIRNQNSIINHNNTPKVIVDKIKPPEAALVHVKRSKPLYLSQQLLNANINSHETETETPTPINGNENINDNETENLEENQKVNAKENLNEIENTKEIIIPQLTIPIIHHSKLFETNSYALESMPNIIDIILDNQIIIKSENIEINENNNTQKIINESKIDDLSVKSNDFSNETETIHLITEDIDDVMFDNNDVLNEMNEYPTKMDEYSTKTDENYESNERIITNPSPTLSINSMINSNINNNSLSTFNPIPLRSIKSNILSKPLVPLIETKESVQQWKDRLWSVQGLHLFTKLITKYNFKSIIKANNKKYYSLETYYQMNDLKPVMNTYSR